MKRCSKCCIEKDLNQFSNAKHTKDKRQSWCRSCCNAQAKIRNSRPETKAAKSLYDKKYIVENRERLRAQSLAYYYANKEKCAASVKKWTAANPIKRLAITRSHRRKRAAGIKGGISSKNLSAWLERQSLVCHWCEAQCENGYHIDHVMPLSKGGAHEAWNLVIACQPCNQRKSAKHPLDWLAEIGYCPT